MSDINTIWGGFTLQGVTLRQMLLNLNDNMPYVVSAIFGFCYISGFWLTFRGIYKLKEYGELRTMMSSNTDLRGPIMIFIAAIFMLYLPTAIQTMEHTFFSDYNAKVIGYYVSTGSDEWTFVESIVIELVRVAGLIAFIKGILILASLGGQSTGQNSLGKAATFLLGGVMCLNIRGVIAILASTFGLLASNTS